MDPAAVACLPAPARCRDSRPHLLDLLAGRQILILFAGQPERTKLPDALVQMSRAQEQSGRDQRGPDADAHDDRFEEDHVPIGRPLVGADQRRVGVVGGLAGPTAMPVILKPATSVDDEVLDDLIDTYVDWREQSCSVWLAYGRWSDAPPGEAPLRFAAYLAELDQEHRACDAYEEAIVRTARLSARDARAFVWCRSDTGLPSFATGQPTREQT